MTASKQLTLEQREARRRAFLVAQVSAVLPALMDTCDLTDELAEMIVDGNGPAPATAAIRRQLRDYFIYHAKSPEAWGAASRLNDLLGRPAR